MKTDEMLKKIGQEAIIEINGLSVNVIVKKAKLAYGKARFLITPKSGTGEIWMQDVKFKDQDGKAGLSLK